MADTDDLIVGFFAALIVMIVGGILVVLSGALFLWVAVEVFGVGRWSWLNAIAVGMCAIVVWAYKELTWTSKGD